MGLIVEVYRTGAFSDCGGLSSRVNRLTLVNVSGPFEPRPDAPAARLECHYQGIVRIVPVEKTGHMAFGGNFAATSDSRFRQAVEALTHTPFYGAVAIHDYRPTANDYD